MKCTKCGEKVKQSKAIWFCIEKWEFKGPLRRIRHNLCLDCAELFYAIAEDAVIVSGRPEWKGFKDTITDKPDMAIELAQYIAVSMYLDQPEDMEDFHRELIEELMPGELAKIKKSITETRQLLDKYLK